MKSVVGIAVGFTGGVLATLVFVSVVASREPPASRAEKMALMDGPSQASDRAVQGVEALRPKRPEHDALGRALGPRTASSVSPAATVSERRNDSAIANYLGRAVPAPANLDPKYGPEELSAVFSDLTHALGINVRELGVDSSEFPFIIHGRLESSVGAGFFKKIDAELRLLPGYTNGGSVTGKTSDGMTYFALNITPPRAYPREQSEAIRRRLMVRLQMVAAAWEDASRSSGATGRIQP